MNLSLFLSDIQSKTNQIVLLNLRTRLLILTPLSSLTSKSVRTTSHAELKLHKLLSSQSHKTQASQAVVQSVARNSSFTSCYLVSRTKLKLHKLLSSQSHETQASQAALQSVARNSSFTSCCPVSHTKLKIHKLLSSQFHEAQASQAAIQSVLRKLKLHKLL